MTSMILKRLQRDPKFRKQEQPPPAALDTSVLNDAIGELIRQAAQAGAEAAVEKQRPAPRTIQEQFDAPPLSDKFPPPPPKAAPQTMREIQLYRDETGRANRVTVGNMTLNIQRNQEGRIVRMVPADISDGTPPVPPAPLNAS